MKVDWVTMEEVVELVRAPIEIEPDALYQQAGVRGFGRGLFSYEPVPGAELGRMRYFGLEPNRLVVSNIKAWEGAVAVTSPGESGRTISNRFLTYRSKGVNLSYICHWLLSDPGLRLLGQASPGSADQNRTLSIANFGKLPLPLPSRSDQDRIAAHLASVEKRVAGLNASAPHLMGQLPQLLGKLLTTAVDGVTVVQSLCANRQLVIHPGDDLRGAEEFVGLEHIESHTGRRIGGRPVGDESGRKLLFEPGQVTYGYLRPCLNKVWAADRTGLCSVEQFTLTPVEDVDARVLSVVLRSEAVWRSAREATNNLQLPRLRLGSLMAFQIPDVRGLDWEAVRPAVERLTTLVIRETELQRGCARLQASILPAARNEIFSALR